MRLWVTRAEPGAGATAARLSALGHKPLVAPLLWLEPLAVSPDGLAAAAGDGAALAFTSRAGVAAFADRTPDRDARVFAVGDATAEAARAAGWVRVESADGDGAALARLILARAPNARIVAPGAREPAFDLPAALGKAGVQAVHLPLYASVSAQRTPPSVRAALAAGKVGGLLLHSPAAARALRACAESDPATGEALHAVSAFALSAACAAPVDILFARPVRVAAAPRERDLLALLDPA